LNVIFLRVISDCQVPWSDIAWRCGFHAHNWRWRQLSDTRKPACTRPVHSCNQVLSSVLMYCK